MNDTTDKPKRTILYVTYDRLFFTMAAGMMLTLSFGKLGRELLGPWGNLIPLGLSLALFTVGVVIMRRDTKYLAQLTQRRKRKLRFTAERTCDWRRWQALRPTIEVVDEDQWATLQPTIEVVDEGESQPAES